MFSPGCILTKAIRPDPKITMRRAALITLPVFIAVLIWALNARVASVDVTSGHAPEGKLPLWVAIITSGIVALMAGTIGALIISNFRRWRVVLHPNLGRILGALTLWILMPVTIFAYIPWISGPLLVIVAIGLNPIVSVIALLSLLPWYLVSCLLVSGVGHRWLRVALFGLVWWGAYSVLLLYIGFQVFRL